jgi:hypothetical protein
MSDGEQMVLMVSFDLDKAPNPRENLDAIMELTKIPEENILYSAIHTHCAPITSIRPFEKPNDISKKPVEVQKATRAYEKIIKEQMLEAVTEAIKVLSPARMDYGYGKSYININRNEDYYYTDESGAECISCGVGNHPEGYVDPTLFVMKVEDLNGMPIAFFINYAVHNVAMIWNSCGIDGKVLITGDIGGNVMQIMEERFPGSVAVWSSGAAGDINPIMMNEVFYPNPRTGKPEQYIFGGGDAPVAILNLLVGRHIADVIRVVGQMKQPKEETQLNAVIEWSQTPGRSENDQIEPDAYKVRLHLIRIGDVALYGIGGELYSSLGKWIRNIAPMKNTVVINHDASLMVNSGYIYDDSDFEHAQMTQGGIVGMSHTKMLPGFIRDSLEEHTLHMFTKIL